MRLYVLFIHIYRRLKKYGLFQQKKNNNNNDFLLNRKKNKIFQLLLLLFSYKFETKNAKKFERIFLIFNSLIDQSVFFS